MTDDTLPPNQPTAETHGTNHWWFPIGTKLVAKENPISPNIVAGEEYTVTREPWFAHDGHDAWSIEVKAENDVARIAFVTEFIRVRA